MAVGPVVPARRAPVRIIAYGPDDALRGGPATEVYVNIPAGHCLMYPNQGKYRNKKNKFSFAHNFFSLKMYDRLFQRICGPLK
jgi:hypothetical protein